AEHRARDLADAAGPAAGRAGRNGRARLCAVAAAPRARGGNRERDAPLHPGGRLAQGDLHARDDVAAAPAARAADQVVAEEGREDVREAAEVEVVRRVAAAAQAGVAVAVVELARVRLREHLV